MRILVTRPEPEAEHTAVALRAHGHDVLMAPMLSFEPVQFTLPGEPFAAVVMTSANAARALKGHSCCSRLISLPLFTVGVHTAEAARAVGFAEVHSADGDRNDLAKLLSARFRGTRSKLIYLCAENRAGDLRVAPQCVSVVTAIVYRMVKTNQFSDSVTAALLQRQIDGVMHFSRRSAEAYVDCALCCSAMERALEPFHYCLSAQVATPLAAHGARGIKIAAQPDEAALIELVGWSM